MSSNSIRYHFSPTLTFLLSHSNYLDPIFEIHAENDYSVLRNPFYTFSYDFSLTPILTHNSQTSISKLPSSYFHRHP